MSSPIAFMCRRARLILGETQAQFADHMRVDTSTVSRWERDKGEPSAPLVSYIRNIIQKAEPCHSRNYIEHAPTLKVVVDADDFSKTVIASRGLLQITGTTFDELIDDKQFWTEDDQKVNDIVHADTRWKQGAIAFVETTHKASFGWVHTILAPLAETNCTLWEGMTATEENPKFQVKLTAFDDPGDP
jgi:transcriptional regulator with XRE-family HTH domain